MISRLSQKRPGNSSKKHCWSARRCVVFAVFSMSSLMWLLTFVAGLYADLSADLGVYLQSVGNLGTVSLCNFAVEADEMWSFTANKSNKQWIWIASGCEKQAMSSLYISATIAEKMPGNFGGKYRRFTGNTTRYLLYRSL